MVEVGLVPDCVQLHNFKMESEFNYLNIIFENLVKKEIFEEVSNIIPAKCVETALENTPVKIEKSI